MQLTTDNRVGASLTRIVANAGAIFAILASTALGTYFGYQIGHHFHWVLGIVFGAAALGGELLKPVAVAGAFDAARRWHIGKAIACTVVALICIAYSVTSELALTAGSRGDIAAEREAGNGMVADAKADKARLTADLAGIAKARPLAELDPMVAAAPVRCAIHVSRSAGRQTICTKDAKLLAEHGRAKARATLEAKLAKIDSPSGVAVKDADPLAATVGFYLRSAGYQAPADRDLARWLWLIPVGFIEITSALGLIVVRSLSQRDDQIVPTDGPGKPMEPELVVEPSHGTIGTVVQFPAKPSSKAAVLAYVQSQETVPSQSYLKQRFHVPKSTVSRWMGEWQADGLLTRQRNGRCNTIRRSATA